MLGVAPKQVARFRSTRSSVTLSPFLQTGLLLFLSLVFGALNVQKNPQMISMRAFVADYVHHIMALGSQPFLFLKRFQEEWHMLVRARDENVDLQQRVKDLDHWHYTARVLMLENKQLLKSLKALPEDANVFLTAKIYKILDPHGGSQLVLGAGKNQGLVKDQAVLIHGHLAGRLMDIHTKTSRILPLNDPLSRIPVILELSGLRAILAGTPAGALILTHREENAPLQIGELVVSSGEGGSFPRGFPIGLLEKTTAGDWQVNPILNLHDLSFAQVLDPLPLQQMTQP